MGPSSRRITAEGQSISPDHCRQRPGLQPDGTTVMGYYDGNTVAAMWNYAQNYAMSDNSFLPDYGPTLPGHINLVSGNTHGIILHNANANPDCSVFINPADGSVTWTTPISRAFSTIAAAPAARWR